MSAASTIIATISIWYLTGSRFPTARRLSMFSAIPPGAGRAFIRGQAGLAYHPHGTLCALSGTGGTKISDDNVRRIASIFCRVGLGRIYASGGRRLSSRPFAGNPLTSDPARFMRNMEMARLHPDLALGGPTAQWLYNALDTARRVNRPDFHEGPRMPVLIVAAGADRVVSTPVIERFVARTRNVSLVTITGARHEMLQETDFYREQLWAAFDAFIPEASDVETMPETLEP